MPSWYYFNRPKNVAFHDLTSTRDSKNHVRSLLGLGLKFIPTPFFTNHNLEDTKKRLLRAMKLQAYFAGTTTKSLTKKQLKIYVRSKWTPGDWMLSRETIYRGNKFFNEIKSNFIKQRGHSNLLPLQRRALAHLQDQSNLIVVGCDKNMGPSVIERDVYIKKVLEHLSDTNTYEKLDIGMMDTYKKEVKREIDNWFLKYGKVLSDRERKYLIDANDEERNTFAYFYATMKVHKSPVEIRPITACCGSMLYRLGMVVDMYLQEIAKTFNSYVKNSRTFKDAITARRAPPGTKIFTADARAMYTNINTRMALREIKQFLFWNQSKLPGMPIGAICDGLKIIMENNIFTFGDTLWKQINGAAMGQPPSPSYATISYGIHELKIVPELKRMGKLIHYFRYLDDIFGAWLPDGNTRLDLHQWNEFKTQLNSWHGLEWDISERTNQVDFLDLKVDIDPRGRINTDLFEKALNLYLYITPSSSHPPGVLMGLILGNCYRINSLISVREKRKAHLNSFYLRLRARGYSRNTLLPIFRKAAEQAKDRKNHELMMERVLKPKPQNLYFHLRYHPGDPPSRKIQKAWNEVVIEPPRGKTYSKVVNTKGVELGDTRLLVAYKRAPNLGNLLSSKLIHRTKGPPVSSYMD